MLVSWKGLFSLKEAYDAQRQFAEGVSAMISSDGVVRGFTQSFKQKWDILLFSCVVRRLGVVLLRADAGFMGKSVGHCCSL